MKKLAIITTHPIQYNAPLFKLLNERANVAVKVFYTWGEGVLEKKYDPGFAKTIEWDIPLLEGYEYTFVENVSKNPGSHHFKGIDNPSLVETVSQWDPDSILVFGWSFKSHLQVLRHFKGKKKILFRGDSNSLKAGTGVSLKKIARNFFLRWVYRHIDVALYVGTANKNYFIENGLKEQQLVFAPHAIDNNRFMKTGDREPGKKPGTTDETTVFIFTGKFEPVKNPHLLLDTFLRLEDPRTQLLMVGNGILETALKEKVDQQPTAVKSRIRFMPFQNQLIMPDIYRMGDILILTSLSETWGLSVNEAMACSRAILVTDTCGCAVDLVEPGVNGFIFKNNDGDDLLDKMKKFMLNQSQIAAMGRQSLQKIQPWKFENVCIAIEQSI